MFQLDVVHPARSKRSNGRTSSYAPDAPRPSMAPMEPPAAIESKLVRRDQFNITPQGIVHKPTDAFFTPHPGDPFSGIERSGQLGNRGPHGDFDPAHVHKMMRQLWAEYVASNPRLFNL